MRISNEQAQQIAAAQKIKRSQGAREVDDVKGVTGTDAVAVSSQGLALQKALQVLSSVPDIRSDKVAALKARVDAGTYAVSGRDTAQSMLKHASERYPS